MKKSLDAAIRTVIALPSRKRYDYADFLWSYLNPKPKVQYKVTTEIKADKFTSRAIDFGITDSATNEKNAKDGLNRKVEGFLSEKTISEILEFRTIYGSIRSNSTCNNESNAIAFGKSQHSISRIPPLDFCNETIWTGSDCHNYDQLNAQIKTFDINEVSTLLDKLIEAISHQPHVAFSNSQIAEIERRVAYIKLNPESLISSEHFIKNMKDKFRRK